MHKRPGAIALQAFLLGPCRISLHSPQKNDHLTRKIKRLQFWHANRIVFVMESGSTDRMPNHLREWDGKPRISNNKKETAWLQSTLQGIRARQPENKYET